MSDGIDRSSINFENFFQECYEVKNSGHLKARIWYTPARGGKSLGVSEYVHGVASSHKEYSLAVSSQMALDEGFDILAIEGMSMSVDGYATTKNEGMNIQNHERDLMSAISSPYARRKVKNARYHVGTFHSAGAGAVLRILNRIYDVRTYSHMPRVAALYQRHDTMICLNPYFITALALIELKHKIYSHDPTGRLWVNGFMKRTQNAKEPHIIDDKEYNIPVYTKNLVLPMPAGFPEPVWDGEKIANMPKIAGLASTLFTDEQLYFFLGDQDLQNNHILNMDIWKHLNVHNKHMRLIRGGNHFFDNVPTKFENEMQKVVWLTAQKAKGYK